MDNNTILLVQPPIQDYYLTRKRTIPYGLASIAASAVEKGFQVKIIDALASRKNRVIDLPKHFSHLIKYYLQSDLSLFGLFHQFYHFGYSWEHLGNLIRKEKPFLAGISCLFTAYADQTFQTASLIRKIHKNCIIVVGGHHPTHFPEKVLEHNDIDFVLRGEAENSFTQLCTAIKHDRTVTGIPCIAFKNKDTVHINKPAWIQDLGELPVPAVELIDSTYYQRNKRHAITVVSSRGCPMPCSYCCVSRHSAYAGYRKRPTRDVIDEIKIQLDNSDIGFIDFEDENLCLDKDWFYDLFSELKPVLKNRQTELRAMNGLFPGSLSPDVILMLKQTGFRTLNLSLGSFDPNQLARFKRPDIRMHFESALETAADLGLNTVTYILAAAPGQDAVSSLNDLLYLMTKQTLIGLSIFYPAPGSLDYSTCMTNNLLPDNFSLMRSSALPVEDKTSRLEAITLLRLARLINFMKFLIDTSGRIPPSKKISNGSILKTIPNREEISIQLLQAFLSDGKIRGITKKGELYTHHCDDKLVSIFLDKISSLHIAGAVSDSCLCSST